MIKSSAVHDMHTFGGKNGVYKVRVEVGGFGKVTKVARSFGGTAAVHIRQTINDCKGSHNHAG